MPNNASSTPRSLRWMKRLVAAAMLMLTLVLSQAVLDLPRTAEGLRPRVAESLDRSGASNPVTAVLLTFRGYDTLLEVTVLLLALLGTWSAASPHGEPPGNTLPASGMTANAILTFFVQLLTPLIVMVGAYLLWAGSHAPGGAFQAGAVLAAAGVLLSLTRTPASPQRHDAWLRGAVTFGLATFLLVAVAPLVTRNVFLRYPPAWAGSLILLIEAASAISIAAILAALFRGRPLGRGASSVSARAQDRKETR